jgi:hypothetical protein
LDAPLTEVFIALLRFLSRFAAVILLVTRFLFSPSASDETRTFRMGFTPHPYDFNDAAFKATYDFISLHGDIIAQHLDEGVPWQDALDGSPFDANVLADINRRVALTTKDQTVFLSITPLDLTRSGLAKNWGKDSHLPLPETWATRRLDDPHVTAAFCNYARRMIGYFHPRYVAYGIEVSEMARSPDTAAAFVGFSAAIYGTLKREFPDIAFFPTFTLGDAVDLDRPHVAFVRALLPYADVLAVSTYPYVWDGIGGDASRIPADWFAKFAAIAPEKPLAISETGFIAQTFTHHKAGVTIPGSPEQQAAYVSFLLTASQELHATFVIWYVPIDYDRLWNLMAKQGADEWFRQWISSGLQDAEFANRPGLAIWDGWLQKSLRVGR